MVAEHGDVGHGAVKSDSLMEQGVVGRDEARRVAKPVAQSVTKPMPVRDREKDREMLARVKEFDGDIDIGIDIDIEPGQPGEFDQELKDCVAESRRVLRRES